MRKAYATELGVCYQGLAEEVLASKEVSQFAGKIDLIFTSPPFPLNTKKKYGNLQGQAYVDWLGSFADLFRCLLAPTGSIVLEVGNAWEPGKPVMSTLALRALIAFLDKGRLMLCEQFIYYNPAKLPTPAQWVNIERIRVKDSYTHLWWMATTERPKADNRRVLKQYSQSMQRLLEKQAYNAGQRPSEHIIGETSFLHDNTGAIPSNVITFANTQSATPYLSFCREQGLRPHPARMPTGLAEFFVKFLTVPGDMVLDPFAGSNTTGAAAEALGRRWVAIEADVAYVEGSRGRFVRTLADSDEQAA